MGLKQHTIILVPHTRARFRKWRVSNRQLIVGASVAGLLLAISCFTIWAFLTTSVDQRELTALAEENRQLRQVNQEFERNVHELKGRLTEFEERTRRLAIVAGLDGADVEQESGVGGGDPLEPAGTSGASSAGLEHRLRLLSDELDSVTHRLRERQRRISATPAISPVRGILTSGYGYRRDPLSGQRALHRAIDISTAPGQPVVATADGIVLEAERSGRLGNAVFIAHGFGMTTRYGHLARLHVKPGRRVKRGDVVGFVGNTGRTTGYHLHYEVRIDGRPVNPLVHILDRTPKSS